MGMSPVQLENSSEMKSLVLCHTAGLYQQVMGDLKPGSLQNHCCTKMSPCHLCRETPVTLLTRAGKEKTPFRNVFRKEADSGLSQSHERRGEEVGFAGLRLSIGA